jgi:hypothetical protein
VSEAELDIDRIPERGLGPNDTVGNRAGFVIAEGPGGAPLERQRHVVAAAVGRARLVGDPGSDFSGLSIHAVPVRFELP